MQIKHSKLLTWSAFVLSCLIYIAGVWHVGSAIWGDTHYYYAYTKSIVMDRDLDFANEAYHPQFGFPNPPVTSALTGRVENIFSPGAPLLWIPSFILGQILTWILKLLGFAALPLDGYSFLTQLSVGLSAIGFSFVGLWLIFESFSQLFSRKIALQTTVFLLATTSLLYYTLLDPFNSHSASFLLSSLILWGMSRKNKNEQTLGLSLGWLGLIRNQDILLSLPIFAWFLFQSIPLSEKIKKIVKMGLIIAGVMSIQLLITQSLYGQVNSPYILHGQQLNWLQPDFMRVLFSFGNGLINFSPIVIITLIGLISLIKKHSSLAMIGLSFFILELYVIASWVPEIIGGPYGSRMFTATLPWLGLGLAQFLALISQKKSAWQIITLILGLILFLHNLMRTSLMLYLW